MAHHDDNGQLMGALHTPVRNHYFYGKLLDARHFTMEQKYFNGKRALLNRLITGYGVICGLDLVLTDERDHIIVQPGVAIDKWGREIVVPRPSHPIPCERLPGAPQGEEEWIHLCLAYHECDSDPTPVLAAECDETGPCAPDTIRERYELLARPGRVPEPPHECSLHDLIAAHRIRFTSLANWITRQCDPPPPESCIPLGDIFIPPDGICHSEDVHAEHRPIVYSNDLLYELILGLAEELLQGRRGK
ncbi:MAG: hypothetical protein ONB48_11905 [candidate division KSB1 bacterium]|nr:hypothetical protein [candidate division KSB1 bacterium]MDZ7273975.1 hypothetical protein [candidate division KSB1 bacterium]MDZ7286348.1 hypothetical protein [candidate division KSB1 bacterium]MDZ7296576.1 hypothetical protein [candidate division KSB1 bacterium]MDZ7306109.1 hypothetical protein [candidate division KSB1 bacterium]